MKCILLWICLISEAFPLPTLPPSDISPKLIYKGHHSSRGVNVYVFQFVPHSKEAKDSTRGEDTTMQNDLQGDRNDLKGEENGENYDDTIIPTNKPASLYGENNAPETETSTRYSTQMPDLVIDTINSTIGAAQNDIAMYEDAELLSNATEGLQTGMSHSRDAPKTNGHGHGNGNDYYATEGSALDIPGYIDTDNGKQSPNTDFPTTVNDLSNVGCSESEGQCKIPPKSKDHSFVTQPTTRKDYSKGSKYGQDAHANKEGDTIDHTVKQRTKPTKQKKDKSEKKTDHDVNKKDIPIRAKTGKIIQYHREQRRKIGGKRHSSQYYRHSSSESDSSQEFD